MISGLISEIIDGVWMMNLKTASGYIQLVESILKGEFKTGEDFSEERKKSQPRYATFKNGVYQVSDYGLSKKPEDAPENSIMVMNINGPITKYDQFCGPSGMLTKSELLKRADNTKNITGILLVIESGGGNGYASRLMNETINGLSKPVVAFNDDLAASAAYQISSATDLIISNSNIAEVGSIGTFITIVDFEEHWKQQGIKILEIYAKASKDKNKEYYDALKGNTEGIRAFADRFNEEFLKSVENNRKNNLKSGRDVWGTGKLFFAEKAIEIGLIDEIGSFEYAVQRTMELANESKIQ